MSYDKTASGFACPQLGDLDETVGVQIPETPYSPNYVASTSGKSDNSCSNSSRELP